MLRYGRVVEVSIGNYVRDLEYLRKPDKFAKQSADKAKISNVPDAMEIINRSMDIQQILFELAYIINSYFRFQALVVILSAFIVIVFDSFYLLDSISSDNEHFLLTREETRIYLAYQLCTNIGNILVMVVACNYVTSAAHRTGRLVHKILLSTTNPAMRERLMQFSMQLNFNKLKFTAFGMFNIDATLIYAIAGATTTYLIILAQMSSPSSNDATANRSIS